MHSCFFLFNGPVMILVVLDYQNIGSISVMIQYKTRTDQSSRLANGYGMALGIKMIPSDLDEPVRLSRPGLFSWGPIPIRGRL